MAKIKVIDLLNKIANGEEVPEKILYRSDILKFDKEIQDYIGISKTGSGSFFDYLFVNHPTSIFINDEVTVIEEQQDIDIQEIKEFHDKEISTAERLKIDELVQAVKQLDRQIKDKE